MLFAARKEVLSSIVLLVVAIAGAAASSVFGLGWDFTLSGGLIWRIVAGLGALFCLDGILHSTLWLLFGRRYLARFEALAEFFDGQGGLELGAAVTAAPVGEELLFRGLLMRSLLQFGRLPALWAVLLSAVLTGLAYWRRDPDLAPFAAWAALQALVFGALYAATGSLIVTMLVHALHDLALFAVFARVRSANAR